MIGIVIFRAVKPLQGIDNRLTNCDTLLQVWVKQVPQERNKTIRVTSQLLQDENPITVYLYIRKDTLHFTHQQIAQGDILLVRTSLARPDSLGEFDYATYLLRQGISGIGFVKYNGWERIGHQTIHTPSAIAERWRTALINRYKRFDIEEPELGVLASLTLGYRDSLDADVQAAYSAAGAMHVLAVSGLHVGFIYILLVWLLTVFKRYPPLYEDRKRQVINAVIVILTLWIYACMTGLSPSVTRAVLMCSLVQIGIVCRRQISTMNIVAASAFISLFINPDSLYSVSFQLSYSAVIAIVLLSEGMQIFEFKNNLVRNTIGWAYGVIIVSIAAQTGTIPWTLYYFGQTSNYFILTNLLVIPLASIMLYTALAFFALSWCPIIGNGIAWLLDIETWGMNQWTKLIENLPGSTSHLSINGWQVALLFIAISATYISFKKGKLWWLSITALSLALFCAICYI